jgi:hypothetical protein
MISKFLDFLSEFLAHRKGLIPLVGIVLILCNLVTQFMMPGSLLASSNIILHIGMIVSILGLMLYWAL